MIDWYVPEIWMTLTGYVNNTDLWIYLTFGCRQRFHFTWTFNTNSVQDMIINSICCFESNGLLWLDFPKSVFKTIRTLCKTKGPLCLPPHLCKFLDLSIHVTEQHTAQHMRKASNGILLWTPRLWCSSQLCPTCVVLHLHNHRESSLLSTQDFS